MSGTPPGFLERARNLLLEFGEHVRDAVIGARATRPDDELTQVVGQVAADVIYAIDRIGEARVLAWFAERWPADQPVRLVMEGIEDHELVTFPHGAPSEAVAWVCIVDPIDGTRNLMYDKRSGWVLAGLAPARRDAHGRPAATLRDICVAAMTEIPTSRQWRADQFSAVAGCGPQGVVASMHDVRRGGRSPLAVTLSGAEGFTHGFASFAHYLPDGKAWLAALEQALWDTLEPYAGTPRQVFEDQYICSAGQIAEILCGRDRMIGDLRPFALQMVGASDALATHPYDLCTSLVLTEAGGVLEDPFGQPLDPPLDTTTPVAWMAYANEALAHRVRAVLPGLLRGALGGR